MDKKLMKIFVILIVVLLLIIFFLSILNFVSLETFWVAAVLVAVFAFLILPKLNKKIQQ